MNKIKGTFGIKIGSTVIPTNSKAVYHSYQNYFAGVGKGVKTTHEWVFNDTQYLVRPDGSWFVALIDKPDWNKDINGFICLEQDVYEVDSREGEYISGHGEIAYTTMVESSKGKTQYEVLTYKDGSLSCNCPAWKYQGGITRGCKHTKKVLDDRK
jgi:hypothetical protein